MSNRGLRAHYIASRRAPGQNPDASSTCVIPRKSTGPVYYASKKAWYANIKGEQTKLVEGPKKATEQEAKARYDKLKKARDAEVEGDKSETWAVLNAYLRTASTRTAPPPLAPN